MKFKSHITLATLLVAGMFATGCQQLQQTAGAAGVAGASQQMASSSQQQTATTKPAEGEKPASTTSGATSAPGTHSHPAIPGCTNSVTHTHKFNDPKHTHSYGCKGGKGKAKAVGAGKGGMPKVKAKGKYKGPVSMDKKSKTLMQQYQQR